MNLVTDCSFIMSSILPDENQKCVEDIYNDISNNTYKVYVPLVFYLEYNNVLLSALKRKRIEKKSMMNNRVVKCFANRKFDRILTLTQVVHAIMALKSA